MASGGAFGGARGYTPRAPEKGVFPLDHFGECRPAADAYAACLRGAGGDAGACQPAARAYLECRMARSLMAPQDLAELGFDGDGESGGGAPPAAGAAPPKDERGGGAPAERRREAAGFVAGLRRFEDK
jgi:cytochrome c oxidase assembly protein subunit 19